MSEREPWGADTAEPWLPDRDGQEYEEWRERVSAPDEDERSEEMTARLEYLREELRAERISYGELAELQGLAEYIKPGDVELLEAAGVPEFPDESGEENER